MHKFKKITKEINESNNIYVNMELPRDLKGRSIVGGPSSPNQGISGLLDKFLTSIDAYLKA